MTSVMARTARAARGVAPRTRARRGAARLLLALLAAAALAALEPTPALATDLQGVVHVRAAGGAAPGPGVLDTRAGLPVTLFSVETGQLVARTLTDKLGRYGFRNVPPGHYTVQVGYPATLAQVTIAVEAGIVQQLPALVVGNVR
jgi:Carboxypeptidase regulatory-like domain